MVWLSCHFTSLTEDQLPQGSRCSISRNVPSAPHSSHPFPLPLWVIQTKCLCAPRFICWSFKLLLLGKLKWSKSCSGFRGCQLLKSRPLTRLDTALIPCLPWSAANQVAPLIRKVVSLGILEPMRANPPGPNKILWLTRWNKQHYKKVKIKPELHFPSQTDNDISLQPGIISGRPPNCNLKSHSWSKDTTWDIFSTGTPDCC